MTFFLVFTSSLLQAKICENMNVRIIFDKKEVIFKEVICFIKTSDNMLFYLSKSCQEGRCEILKRKKSNIKISNYNANIGSPGFKLCMELGGVPQIFDFSKDSLSWQSSERCLFEKDFVEISLLTREWKNFITKK